MKRIFLFVAFIAAFFFCACTEEIVDNTLVPSEIENDKLIETQVDKSTLIHSWKQEENVASDDMTAICSFYHYENEILVDSVLFKSYPEMQAELLLEKNNYAITEDLLDSKVVSSFIKRNYLSDGDIGFEEDTLVIEMNDGQIISVPVKISCYKGYFREKEFFFGSDSLLDAKLLKVENFPIGSQTRATYVSQSVNTVYTVELTFKEKNVTSPEIFKLNLVAQATRNVLSEDEIIKVVFENKDRQIIDEKSEKCSFDYIVIMKSGDSIRSTKAITLSREFKGIDTYDKYVSDFGYSFNKSNGIVIGNETIKRTDENWSVYGRNDKYSADISNNVEAELIKTDYSFYHERAVYKDSYLNIDFGYEDIVVSEQNNSVSTVPSDKNGKDKAVYCNSIQAVYMAYNHNLEEMVNLYKTAKYAVDTEIRDAKLEIEDNKVIASLTYVTIMADGSEENESVVKEFPRSFVCNTNWSVEDNSSNQTTASASITMRSTNKNTDGFWSFVNEIRDIKSIVQLNASEQVNSWTTTNPNSIIYTREGKTHSFDKIEFNAVNSNAKTELKKKDGDIAIYAYTDSLTVILGNNKIGSTAPGEILINGKEVVGHRIENKKLEITDNEVIASLTFITEYLDGSVNKEDIRKSFPRKFTCTSNWSSKEANASQETGNLNVSLVSSDVIFDGNWRHMKETRNLSANVKLASTTQKNTWTSVDPNDIIFSKNDITVDFGKQVFSAEKKNSETQLRSKNNNVENYDYSNTISVSFGDNVFESIAPGSIIVEIPRLVERYEIRDPKLEVSDNKVGTSLTFVTIYNDGTEDKEVMSKMFNRSLICETNWASTEDNTNQTTSETNVSLLNSENRSESYWNYKVETYAITTEAQLNNSVQSNKWKAVETNNIVFTREGISYDFGQLNFSSQSIGTDINVVSDNDEVTTYGYANNISVAFGENTKSSNAEGKILVYKPWVGDFPAEWGRFVGATSTLSVNESDNDWVYAWSIRFEKGTLPVIVRRGGASAEVNQSQFEYDTNPKFNGAAYKNGAWCNAIASDEANYMLWTDTNCAALDALIYSTATMWKWNNGSNTVFNNDFTFSIENDGMVLVVKKNGTEFARYRASK
jgi:hypothetical protein